MASCILPYDLGYNADVAVLVYLTSKLDCRLQADNFVLSIFGVCIGENGVGSLIIVR
jgi:hypothetical protein